MAWINVKKQLPKKSGTYFAANGGRYFVGDYNKDLNGWNELAKTSGWDQDVTYWMEIPPIPSK